MSVLAQIDLSDLRGRIEDRLVAKAEKHATKPRAVYQAGAWARLAIFELGQARELSEQGHAERARQYLRGALESLAIANQRARGSYS